MADMLDRINLACKDAGICGFKTVRELSAACCGIRNMFRDALPIGDAIKVPVRAEYVGILSRLAMTNPMGMWVAALVASMARDAKDVQLMRAVARTPVISVTYVPHPTAIVTVSFGMLADISHLDEHATRFFAMYAMRHNVANLALLREKTAPVLLSDVRVSSLASLADVPPVSPSSIQSDAVAWLGTKLFGTNLWTDLWVSYEDTAGTVYWFSPLLQLFSRNTPPETPLHPTVFLADSPGTGKFTAVLTLLRQCLQASNNPLKTILVVTQQPLRRITQINTFLIHTGLATLFVQGNPGTVTVHVLRGIPAYGTFDFTVLDRPRFDEPFTCTTRDRLGRLVVVDGGSQSTAPETLSRFMATSDTLCRQVASILRVNCMHEEDDDNTIPHVHDQQCGAGGHDLFVPASVIALVQHFALRRILPPPPEPVTRIVSLSHNDTRTYNAVLRAVMFEYARQGQDQEDVLEAIDQAWRCLEGVLAGRPVPDTRTMIPPALVSDTPLQQCAVCLGPMRISATTPCGHSFCATCLATWATTQGHNNTCPLCRSNIGSVSNLPMRFCEPLMYVVSPAETPPICARVTAVVGCLATGRTLVCSRFHETLQSIAADCEARGIGVFTRETLAEFSRVRSSSSAVLLLHVDGTGLLLDLPDFSAIQRIVFAEPMYVGEAMNHIVTRVNHAFRTAPVASVETVVIKGTVDEFTHRVGTGRTVVPTSFLAGHDLFD